MKSKRQKLIMEIIENEFIDTQESLQRALERYGYKVTQATVSRDIKELNLIKSVDASGEYKYCPPANKNLFSAFAGGIDISIISNAVVSVDYALNTVVIKCHTGMAQGVCARLDNSQIEKALGTIAGDDTIFVLMRTEQDACEFAQKLNSIIAG